jgi:hypothetical protein
MTISVNHMLKLFADLLDFLPKMPNGLVLIKFLTILEEQSLCQEMVIITNIKLALEQNPLSDHALIITLIIAIIQKMFMFNAHTDHLQIYILYI